ncbi:MAG: hypothetical protein AAF358_26330 [Pseudomonadota bacterium]
MFRSPSYRGPPTVLVVALCLLVSSASRAQDCAETLLVSGFTSNNVHVFDYCAGDFRGTLADTSGIGGAQAIGAGRRVVYVASEKSGQILQFDRASLAPIGVLVNMRDLGISSPTALALGPDGDLYVGGFHRR